MRVGPEPPEAALSPGDLGLARRGLNEEK